MKSYHIHIKGRVQGIGFRPFIYNLAVRNGLTGTVSNTRDGVHILVNCELCSVSKFTSEIKQSSPSQAVITSIQVNEVEQRAFENFTIIESLIDGTPDLLITPDFAICENCRSELLDPANRRQNYPFITCTHCGPRFSIESALPYDRHRTSMETFKMCKACKQEFYDPSDIRFYSQTNSCAECKISQWLVDSNGRNIDLNDSELIEFTCKKIEDGHIVAVKGIGGYLLICDAQNEEKVQELRKKKHRPYKPFAMLYPDLDKIKRDFTVSDDELQELCSAMAPIVLLQPRRTKTTSLLLKNIAPGLDRLGVMLPYAPVLLLISKMLKKPLVATSGNIKGSPIIYDNEEAVKTLSRFADFLLLNNRKIQVPQDDSVVKFSSNHMQKAVIRRSRGYAPGYLQEAIDTSFGKKVLAMGALLKSTFSIWNLGRCHISQFLGDTTEFDAQISYEKTLWHFMELLQFKPEVILVDKHPAYFSTQFGRELAATYEIELKEIQHHKAHFWAVLAENNLLHKDEKCLGVVFDGTGMGNDGAVWGGEFFMYDSAKIERISHLKYFPHILGDKMAREPKLSALSLLHSTALNYNLEKDKFTEDELEFYDKVLENSSLNTSSVGRLFDAVSSLLDFCHINTYEGEAAMYLECAAKKHFSKLKVFKEYYAFEILKDGSIDLVRLTSGIIEDVVNGIDREEIAAKFHNMLVQIIRNVAENEGVRSLAFSGGVLQNCLLIDLIIRDLGKDFNLYFHRDLSPNDECISYGQLVGYYVKNNLKFNQGKVSKIKNLV